MTQKDKADIALTRKMIAHLKAGYGANCKPRDYEATCIECCAREVIKFLEEHIALIKS